MFSKKYLAIIAMIITLLQAPTTANADSVVRGLAAAKCSHLTGMFARSRESANILTSTSMLSFFSALNYAFMDKHPSKDLTYVTSDRYINLLVSNCRRKPNTSVGIILLEMYSNLDDVNSSYAAAADDDGFIYNAL